MSVTPLRLCEWCGEAAHKLPLMCPRITRIRYEGDEINVYFNNEPTILKFTGARYEECEDADY